MGSCILLREAKAVSRQKIEEQIIGDADCWLSLPSLHTREPLSQGDTTPSGLGPLHQSSVRKMAYGYGHRQFGGKSFLTEVTLCQLCQVQSQD